MHYFFQCLHAKQDISHEGVSLKSSKQPNFFLLGSASCHIPAQGFDDEKFSGWELLIKNMDYLDDYLQLDFSPETNHTPRPISKSSRATNIKPGVNISTTMSQPLPLSSTTSGESKYSVYTAPYATISCSECK